MNELYYRTMALDLGDARIGIAVSDLMGIIANGLETYHRVGLQADIAYIADLIKKQEVKLLVVGLPKNMDGTCGQRVDKTYAFVDELKKVIDIKVDYNDERLTTVTAERVLIDADVSRAKRKNVIDKMAATIILQDYLDKNKRGV